MLSESISLNLGNGGVEDSEFARFAKADEVVKQAFVDKGFNRDALRQMVCVENKGQLGRAATKARAQCRR